MEERKIIKEDPPVAKKPEPDEKKPSHGGADHEKKPVDKSGHDKK